MELAKSVAFAILLTISRISIRDCCAGAASGSLRESRLKMQFPHNVESWPPLLSKKKSGRTIYRRQIRFDNGTLSRRIRGPRRYCSSRIDGRTRRVLPCCLGRNDNCAVPYRDTTCYCDQFCYRSNDADCCPDYEDYCSQGFGTSTFFVTRTSTSTPMATTTARTTRRTTTNRSRATPTTQSPTKTTTIFVEFENVCYYKGTGYRFGAKIRINCNECVCERVLNGYYNFVCDENECLVRPNLIDAINQGQYGWRAGNYSFLWGMTLNEGFRYRLGTTELPDAVRGMSKIRVHLNEVIPEVFDSRVIWRDYVTPPRDQGNCASSWAFSSTSVASDRLAIQSRGAIKVVLSPQHLISCRRSSKGRKCKSESVDKAWWVLRRRG